MFGPDDEEKSDSEKRAEEPSKEKEDNGVEKEVKDKAEVKGQGQTKIKDDKKEDRETDKGEKAKPVAEVKEEKKEKKVKEEIKRSETKETVATVAAKQPQKVKPTSGNTEEPMAVSDESEEMTKETSSKPQTEVKSKDVHVNEANNKNKKVEHAKETVNGSNTDDGASSDDLDNLLKIEQECHMLQDFVAKQSETGSDVEQDIELEKEDEMMEVDLEIDLQIKENADKKKTEEKIEIKKVEDQKKDDNKNEEDEPNMKVNETGIVVMADLTAEDLDDEPLVIDESVKSVGEPELSGDDKIDDEPTEGPDRDAEKSPPGRAAEIVAVQSPRKHTFLSTSPDVLASLEDNKESSSNNRIEPKMTTATAETDATSSETRPEDAKQKVETMSELIRTLTSDSEPVKSVNPLVIAPINEVKNEESSPATSASCMQTITPLASLQAVLTATQRSLPTTTAADARLLQAGIQVNALVVTGRARLIRTRLIRNSTLFKVSVNR